MQILMKLEIFSIAGELLAETDRAYVSTTPHYLDMRTAEERMASMFRDPSPEKTMLEKMDYLIKAELAERLDVPFGVVRVRISAGDTVKDLEQAAYTAEEFKAPASDAWPPVRVELSATEYVHKMLSALG